MDPVKARSIARGVHDFLRSPRRGYVAATFIRSGYLDLGGRIVALVSADLLNGPLNIVLASRDGAAFGRFRVDARARASARGVWIDDALTVDLATADVWDPHLAPLEGADRGAVRAGLDAIKSVLPAAPEESLAHGRRRTPRAVDGMDALYSGLRGGDPTAVAHAAERLAGLGAGLTPSGDDVLVGMLVALALFPRDEAPEMRRVVLDQARDRTTRISLAYLEAAAAGNAGEAWHLLAGRLGRREPDRVADAARRVMTFGETSGADMLTGFVLAAEALALGSAPP